MKYRFIIMIGNVWDVRYTMEEAEKCGMKSGKDFTIVSQIYIKKKRRYKNIGEVRIERQLSLFWGPED